MKKEELEIALRNNPINGLCNMEDEYHLTPMNDIVENYEPHRHYTIGTKTYQLDDGLVKVRGVLNIAETMDWDDVDDNCEIVQ